MVVKATDGRALPAGLSGARADREPPAAFSLRLENARLARDLSEKTHGVAPIIGLTMCDLTPSLRP